MADEVASPAVEQIQVEGVDPSTVAVSVHVQSPNGKDSILLEMVSPLDSVMSLRQMVSEYPVFAHHTSYHFELQVSETWVPLNDFVEFGEYTALLDPSTTEFHTRIVLDRYDLRKVRAQVKRLRDVLANPPIPQQSSKAPTPVTPEATPAKEKSAKEQTQEQLAKLKEIHRKLEGLVVPITPTLSAFYSPVALQPPVESNTKATASNAASSKKGKKKQPSTPATPSKINDKTQAELPSSLPKCVESIVLSGFNPPPGPRKLAGDLAYYEVTLTDKKVLHITAHVAGFYVNRSVGTKFDPLPAADHHHLLVDVLLNASSTFSDLYASLLATAATWASAGATSIDAMVQAGATASTGVPQWNTQVKNSAQHEYDANRTQDELSIGLDERGVIRDWNEEYQCARELPNESVRDQIVRARVLYKVTTEFIEAATVGAVAIVDGSIPPINPMDDENAWVYVYNQIFFSRAVEGQKHVHDDTEASHENAYSSANHDLQGVRAYNAVDVAGLHTLATVVVDYLGMRIVGQSIIPGILQGEAASKLIYGSVDSGATIVAQDDMHVKMQKAGDVLLLADRAVSADTSLVGPVEAKGILGADNRQYILDLVRITPKDYHYYFGHEEGDQKDIGATAKTRQELDSADAGKYTALLRPELIQLFARYKTNKDKTDAIANEDTKTPATDTAPSVETKSEESTSAEKEAESVAKSSAITLRFNANVFMSYPASTDAEEAAADEALAKEAAKYLQTLVIPAFVADLRRGAMYPADGNALTDMMHACGINMRYLGRVAALAAAFEPNVSKFVVELFEVEMIARSLKHIVSALFAAQPDLRSTPGLLLVEVLNALLGSSRKVAGSTAPSTEMLGLDKLSLTPSVQQQLTPATLWPRIKEDVARRFGYTLRLWPGAAKQRSAKADAASAAPRVHKSVLLRRVCQRLGWQVASVDYDFDADAPFDVAHVTGMQPVVKHSLPAHPFGHAATLLERARFLVSQGVLGPAYEMLQDASSLLFQVCGGAHEDAALILASTATALYHAGDVTGAISSQRRALGLYTQLKGLDYYDTAFAHANLALYLHANANTAEAVGHLKRAIYLLELAAGPHFPETSVLYYKLGMMCQDVGHVALALVCHREALRRGELDRHQAGLCLHAMAMACALAGGFREALSYEKKALGLYQEVVGDEDPRVVESLKYIELFTAKAVEGAKGRQEIDAVAAADAMANALAEEWDVEIREAEKKRQGSNKKKSKKQAA
ncbi:hypothetical protein DYB32_006731 [Aphanomyces invadans]|uniref:Clu domain-containing protein n=1 Tax=Aphanomyces invadans TaxID=157072 RepID=A0A418AR29_9STRA|nr:hypothetical protein DYB32_006731 [Aphanomyces invadans]